ncbi:hypothetical protein [Saccharopolyspora rosea]|uniref:Uncharacterized protein n=1 Tax=Saccharopolyspora rosea TaxID=524884 RepID=A0ABW3FYP1_9PSEU|nr:hypothetical protein [Saccharopolyspora rosea]
MNAQDEADLPEASVERRAPHAGADYGEVVELCRRVVLGGRGPRYLAHYTDGVFDFAVNDVADGPDPYGRVGHHVVNEVGALDAALEEVRTGRLIRVVLRTDAGAVLCCSVVPREHLVGFVPDVAAVWSADVELAKLVTQLRARVSLGSQNPGGWLSAKPEDLGGPPAPSEVDEERTVPGGDPEQLCRAALSPADLHYAALWGGGEPVVAEDVFDDPAVGRFFTQLDPGARRRFYAELGSRLPTVVGQFGRIVGPVLAPRVRQLTLDVEQGAVYYYRLRPGEYLVGVTLDQNAVALAERRMTDLSMAFAGG